MTGWSRDGDESVNADDGPDDARTISAAPAAAARDSAGDKT